ncbi:MAG: rhomboid family intramembrane serine protease [Azonexus sp.]|nr:rhomboid family intramembrane serine protease [Azonexus sp.]
MNPDRPYMTYGLIALCCFFYLVTGASGASLLEISPETLERLGGNIGLLSLTGDSWRLLTAIFLHGGLLHLAMNMYMLALIGPPAERWYGRTGMLCLYLVGGLWASYASAVWNATHMHQNTLGAMMGMTPALKLVVSVGASGALMALCGALLAAWGLREAPEKTPDLPQMTKALLQVVAINLIMGFVIKEVDQAAHIGGVVAGLALGAAAGVLHTRRHKLRLALSMIAGVGMLGVVLSYVHWHGLRELRQMLDEEATEQAREAAEQQTERLLTAYRENGEMAKQKAATREAKALLASLPPPVSEDEAQGRIFRGEWHDARSWLSISDDETTAEVIDPMNKQITHFDLATGAAHVLKNTTREREQDNGDGRVLARNQDDGLTLKQFYADRLELVKSPGNEVMKYWEICDVPYMGQQYYIDAAFWDRQSRTTLIASLGAIERVRVTQLETGVDVAVLPTVGYPREAKFSKDGKRLYVRTYSPWRENSPASKNDDSEASVQLEVLDISKRLAAGEEGEHNIAAPLICVWSDSLPQ